ncbi:hypothetical protein NQ317_013693 [Molorchus minor]|uniref:Uncharacterized protein n=1 Tax=Molorchus minor TaxID=1323400 RepID=A0ABQ9J0F5_9CUCU|nr:hypothetical protein NQ317_013693 [Molorchus minor]
MPQMLRSRHLRIHVTLFWLPCHKPRALEFSNRLEDEVHFGSVSTYSQYQLEVIHPKITAQPIIFEEVRGIDYDYSRHYPSPPDLFRTLPKPKTTVFGVLPYIFKSKESIATIPEMIRAFPNFPEFSRLCPNSPEG